FLLSGGRRPGGSWCRISSFEIGFGLPQSINQMRQVIACDREPNEHFTLRFDDEEVTVAEFVISNEIQVRRSGPKPNDGLLFGMGIISSGCGRPGQSV